MRVRGGHEGADERAVHAVAPGGIGSERQLCMRLQPPPLKLLRLIGALLHTHTHTHTHTPQTNKQ
jgi:hypothetical protein